MKLRLQGRLPSKIDKDLGYSLSILLRDIEQAFNEIEGIVLSKATHSPAITADTLVKTGQATYRGFTITTATAGAAIDIRDATSAGSGVIIDTIAAGTAAATRYQPITGILCETGIYVDYAGGATGTLVVHYE
jgi:hypothetical protein